MNSDYHVCNITGRVSTVLHWVVADEWSHVTVGTEAPSVALFVACILSFTFYI